LLWYGLASVCAAWLFYELASLGGRADVEHSSYLALCGLVLFAIHPAHVEAVAWVAGRKDLMAGAFALLSAALVARGVRRQRLISAALPAALFLAAACFSKGAATAFLAFLAALLMAGWPVAERTEKFGRLAVLFLLGAVVALATLTHMKMGVETAIRLVNDPGFFASLDRASRIFVSLNGLIVLPVDLGLYHDVYAIGDWHWAASAAIFALLAYALRAILRDKALWAFGVVLAEAPLFVYLQVIPFTTWSLASERFVFVSVAGLCLVLIDLLDRASLRRNALALVLVLFLPCSVLVWNRVADWELEKSLFAREFERQPLYHNAIRDQIVYVLLPQKRYREAKELVASVKESFAADALNAVVEVEQRYRAHVDASLEDRDSNQLLKFCQAVVTFKSALANGYAKIPALADVSYNNLLRSLTRQLELRYSTSRKDCPHG
jgi:hypothetical protein